LWHWITAVFTARIYIYTLYFLCDFVFLKGREEGAEIDEWEDPEFEVYHVTDRFGFIQ